MTDDEVMAAAERAEAATDGPWRWAGYVDGSIELRTVGHGGQRVVTTHRPEPCVVWLLDESIALTHDACEACQKESQKAFDPWVDYRCPKETNLDTIWLRDQEACFIRPANTWAVREKHYRTDVAHVDHPDATFIAHARTDVPALAAEVLRLRAALAALEHEMAGGVA